ncbi:MAG: sel1 repeat family protein [Gammaproteobacteria bacterium]|nr:sel1 repeat family protein [Gammaproteobacteria bacterium]
MKFLAILLILVTTQTVYANKCVDLMQKQEYYEAFDICSSMARKGNTLAQFSVGVMYYQGNGVMSDLAKAQDWIRKAAQNNHSQAQYNLGIMLANGQGSSANLVEAFAWLKISSNNGYSAAEDSVKQLGAELSSSEKEQANERISSIKKEFKLK